jgi:hypothetical protein
MLDHKARAELIRSLFRWPLPWLISGRTMVVVFLVAFLVGLIGALLMPGTDAGSRIHSRHSQESIKR